MSCFLADRSALVLAAAVDLSLARDHRIIAPDLLDFGCLVALPRTYSKSTLDAVMLGLIESTLDRVRPVAHDLSFP